MRPWWTDVVARELGEGGIVRLAAELAETVDEIYLAIALVYAELPHEDAIPAEETERRELARLLGRAIRKPSQFGWGQAVHDSFRERLEVLFGADVIPPGWPDKPPPGGG